MISIAMVASVVLYLIVGGLIFWLLNWAIDYVALPEPFNKVARIALIVLAVFVIINVLLGLVGNTPLWRP